MATLSSQGTATPMALLSGGGLTFRITCATKHA